MKEGVEINNGSEIMLGFSRLSWFLVLSFELKRLIA